MAVKDILSDLQAQTAVLAVISSNTTTNGIILDTADFELGLMFSLTIDAFSDGTYEVQLFESDDSGMAGATQIVAPNILPTDLGANSITQSAATISGAPLPKIGAFANLRYVQARIVSTGVTTGATVHVGVIQKAEQVPV